jgi:OOP family OmpA-OmpF porin
MLIVGLVVTTSVLASTAIGAVKERALSVSPLLGGYIYSNEQQLNSSPVLGVRGGYSITKEVGVEALYDFVAPTDSKYWSIKNISMHRFGVQGLYHFMPDNQLVPYLAAGVSGVKFSGNGVNTQAHSSFDYGAGAKYFVTNTIAVRADLRHLLYGYNSSTFNNVEFMLGATFQFGGVTPAAKVVAPAVVAALLPSSVSEPVKVTTVCAPPPPPPACAPAPEPVVCAPPPPPVVCAPPVETIKMVFSPVTKEDCEPLWATAIAKTAPESVEKRVCSKPENLTVLYGSERVLFEIKYHDEIDVIGKFLNDYPNAHVTINGHADDTGSAGENMQLSLVRAGVLRSHVIYKFKIDRSRIEIKGFGSTKPVAPNKTEVGKAKNRRIEVIFDCE